MDKQQDILEYYLGILVDDQKRNFWGVSLRALAEMADPKAIDGLKALIERQSANVTGSGLREHALVSLASEALVAIYKRLRGDHLL